MSQNYRSRTSIAESQKRSRTRELESAAKRKKLESYVDVCNDVGGYNQLTFEEKDGEDCLHTSLMQPSSLIEESGQGEDMTFRLMNQRRSRFSKNNLDDEKSQFYKFILSKSEEETSRIQELYEHSDLSEDFYVNYVNERIKNTILILTEGAKFTGDAYDTHENFSSEIKEYIEDLLSFKKKTGSKNLKEEINFERQQLQSSKKKTAMYKRNWLMFSSLEKKLSEAYAIFARNVPEFKLKLNLLNQVL